ncbi:yabC [Wigglesworthia glossinidia endosymbiont of Glossina brevipalpis]|uniref:Ribosomal RNA small subunit methyltransferase H n=1 Tax=Wigglesworthia glossinidia brevipalpis TaxID=36870 RepID=RSMH_WIGBR|nr:RecName: Full=Ribosomal RNA small subunit methyltransferase H; AltName: Full=16S rRNA m(4)C1402 methyltransferase; AltName: Full=rRNA (cytosine-N(4)-)-methyltransferase RsmH [Wigglesworthia glossinidia endosymbiont of Glossina brevipalpis]BAC24360.1 yabC [Wigglesworthia glossinidia endosymbiont of Glossina brevipalpis]
MHIPVMLNEVIKSIKIIPNGTYIDATFGCGGHSRCILSKLNEKGKLIVIDRDPKSIEFACSIKDRRLIPIHGNFSKILKYSIKYKIFGKVQGILFDLGLSFSQIKDSNRGFSFMHDGPLDMRMNNLHGISAKEWINNANIKDISFVIKEFGEEKFYKKISNVICKYRKIKNINTTKELVNLINKACGYFYKKKHPARRSFQAIRIYINNELQELKLALNDIIKIISPKGRIVFISFHSLEDRIIKKFIINNSRKKIYPYKLPILESKIKNDNIYKLKYFKKIQPSKKEILYNKKSRSAILRFAEKLKYD